MLVSMLERRALRHMRAGRYEKAERDFERIRHRRPYRAGINYNIGLVKLAQRNFEAAETLLADVVQRYGESCRHLRALGDVYYLWGKREPALHYYQRARRLCQAEEALALLERRIEHCSSDATYQRVLESDRLFSEGNESLRLKDYPRAKEQFERALECDPTNYHALNNLGAIMLSRERRPTEAAEYFERATELSDVPSIAENLRRARRRARSR
jgi:tetratricopeptide (TPR) repeat protein